MGVGGFLCLFGEGVVDGAHGAVRPSFVLFHELLGEYPGTNHRARGLGSLSQRSRVGAYLRCCQHPPHYYLQLRAYFQIRLPFLLVGLELLRLQDQQCNAGGEIGFERMYCYYYLVEFVPIQTERPYLLVQGE